MSRAARVGFLLAWVLIAGALGALAVSGGILPFASTAHALPSAALARTGSSSSSIPPVSCPLAPVNTTFGPFTCEQTLYLTEAFVILIGLTITFYVYKDADKAELPGDAAEVPVTAQEELEFRRRQEAQERWDVEQEGRSP